MEFKLEDSARGQTDNALLEDMRHCAELLGRSTITIAQYELEGRFHPSTIARRFESWTKALKQAGLDPSRSKIGITDDELFENVKRMWIALGRQPRYSEVKKPDSLFSAGTYENRFGSWSAALNDFINWVNAELLSDKEAPESTPIDVSDPLDPAPGLKRRTRREITDRQRFRILVRDGFRCLACGISPLTHPGTLLHVDHVLPYSKGGETVDENLETKCQQCNLGKGNAFER